MTRRWLNQDTFASQEEFCSTFKVDVPDRFNFAFDVVDEIAAADPGRRALVWCDDQGGERVFTMAEIARESMRAANVFKSMGIGKGDAVMLMLRRRYEFWFALLGLCRLGAIAIPATTQLMKKDVAYRVKAASVKAIIAVDEPSLREAVDQAATEVEIGLRAVVGVRGACGPWLDFDARMAAAPDTLDEARVRPAPATSCCSTSPPAPPACPRWCVTISSIRSDTWSPPNIGRGVSRAACI
jgi:acetyl-CoA synthetase